MKADSDFLVITVRYIGNPANYETCAKLVEVSLSLWIFWLNYIVYPRYPYTSVPARIASEMQFSKYFKYYCSQSLKKTNCKLEV